MAGNNYLKNDGNGNIILQNVTGRDINLSVNPDIDNFLETAKEELLSEIKKELDSRFSELIEVNQIAIDLFKQKLDNRISVTNSKNTNTGNIDNIDGNVTFGDNNKSTTYKGDHYEIKVTDGLEAKELIELIEKKEYSNYYGNYSVENNPVYKYFLNLDREDIVNQLINKFEDGQVYFSIKAFNKHQSDWLFDKFVLKLKEYFPEKVFESHSLTFRNVFDIRTFKRELKKKLNIEGEITATKICNSLDKNTSNLFQIVFDIDTENDKFKKFENEFFNFWQNKETGITVDNLSIFQSVKFRNKPVELPWIFTRIFLKKKKQLKNVFVNTNLPMIIQNDIDYFCENTLKNITVKIETKEKTEIQYLWYPLVPEIYFNLIKK